MHLNRHNPALWLVIGAGLWIIDSSIDALLFHKSGFISQIFTPAPQEIYMRLLTVALLIFAVYISLIITKLKKTEKTLQESEKYFRLLTESSLTGVYLIQDNLFRYVNPSLASTFGYEAEELINKLGPLDLTAPENRSLITENIRKRIENGTHDIRYSFSGLRKDGMLIDVEVHGARVEHNGKPAIIGTLLDITERKKAEELIFQNKQDWENTFNSITDMVTVHDKDFNIILANKAAEKILKLPFLEKTESAKCFRYYHGTEAPPEGCPSCNCLKTGRPITTEFYEPHLNTFIELRAIPRFDKDNQLTGLIHIARDITDRKKAEEEKNQLFNSIAKAKREWEITFDSATELIMLLDKDLTIIRGNRSLSDFVGIPLNKLTGHKYSEYFPSDPEHLENIRTGETSEWLEVETENKRWLFVSHRPVFDETDKFLYTIVIATDITKLHHSQQKLMESESELKKKVQELERFYELAVNRELKMKELKKEIEILNAELEKYKK